MNQNKDQDTNLDGGRSGPGDDLPLPGAGASTSNAGHYTANEAGRGGGIVSSSPEAQVNPPGQPQSGHGSATEPVAPGTESAMSSDGQRPVTAPDGGIVGQQNANADSGLSNSAGDDKETS